MAFASAADAQPRGDFDGADASYPIEMGLVVIDGQVIPRPYIVRTDEADQITINGYPITIQSIDRSPREGDRGRDHDRDSDRRRWGRWSPQHMFERGLERDMVFLVVSDLGTAVIYDNRLPDYVDVVTSDASSADKIDALGALGPRRADPRLWQALLAQGPPSPALRERASIIRKQQDEAEARRLAKLNEQERAARAGELYQWVLPMASIGGVLLALAVLLHTLRASWSLPIEQRAWRHIDPTGQRTRAVIQLVAVLVLLNGLDLVFTLLAQQTGQFFELNPVGERFIDSPVALGYYKTTLVALGVGIILFLRQRRAAEITAWWLCAVYVLVLVRWVAVNTVMLA